MGLRWVLASAAALLAAVLFCAPAGAIVGGGPVSLTDHPYQVALVHSDSDAEHGQFCGGSIRDEWHIITAAHCVFDNASTVQGQPLAPQDIDVLAGTENLPPPDAGQRPHVAVISVDPGYDSGNYTHDAALLTLATPISLGAKAEPIQVIDAGAAGAMAPGTSLFVTGWGDTTGTNTYPDLLQGVAVNMVSDDECNDDYFLFGGISAPLEICAAAPGKDSCQGDSGGPLVNAYSGSTPADDRLVGIVSSGQGCADPSFPGIYTEVAAPTIRSFVLQPQPVAAPVNQAAPTISGAAVIGGRLACSPGAWTGSPSLSYQFVRSNASGDVGIAANASDYTVSTADAGMSLRCIVTATNAGGTSIAESARTGVVPGPIVQPPPPSQNVDVDVNAPVARVTRTKCTSSRCTLTVTVTDAGFSSGIKALKATVKSTYRGTCKRKGRTRACTKTKTSKPKVSKLSATRFQVVASKLPVGKHLFTLIAVDNAGHAQRLPTKKTVTTKKPKKKRR